ncbi:unnamed protein product [Tenebrio molitor]|jgi:hypothetical protein|nr:unnamed protein product [Tenebrio molitor]
MEVVKKNATQKKQKRHEISRKGTVVYALTVHGEAVKICKQEFLNIHDLQDSRGRVDRIVSKKIRGSSIPNKNKRGKHSSRPNKLSVESLQSVRDHLNHIPKYQSHYSLQQE